VYIFLHSGNEENHGVLARHAFDPTPRLSYPFGTNRGVAKSWNDAIIDMRRDGREAMIIVNDDIVFGPGTIEVMAREAIVNGQDVYAVTTYGPNQSLGKKVDHGFACFALTSLALETVGAFDENYRVAYNEDLDYDLRARRAGLNKIILPLDIVHEGSASIRLNPMLRQQNFQTHHRNDEYWERKWGAEKPDAKFKQPFNNRDFHPYYISFDARSDPYPGHTNEVAVKI
jgi:GT2 family glycosyltransferase